jgi:hypothetical protein
VRFEFSRGFDRNDVLVLDDHNCIDHPLRCNDAAGSESVYHVAD